MCRPPPSRPADARLTRQEGKTHPPRRPAVQTCAFGGLWPRMRGKESRDRRTRPAACGSLQAAFPATPAQRKPRAPHPRAHAPAGCPIGLPRRWPVSGSTGQSPSPSGERFFARSFRCSSPAERERAAHSGPASLAVAEPLRPPCAGTAAETTIRNQSPSSKIAAVRANGGPGSRLDASLV